MLCLSGETTIHVQKMFVVDRQDKGSPHLIWVLIYLLSRAVVSGSKLVLWIEPGNDLLVTIPAAPIHHDLANIGATEARILQEHLPDSSRLDIWPRDYELDQVTELARLILDFVHKAAIKLIVLEGVVRPLEHVGEAYHLGYSVLQG